MGIDKKIHINLSIVQLVQNNIVEVITSIIKETGVNPNNISEYTIVNDITPEQKLANEFKAQKQFFARIDILMKYVNKEETDKSNDLFAEMMNVDNDFGEALLF